VHSYGGDAVRIESLDAYKEANTNSQELYKENRPASADNFNHKPMRNYFEETVKFYHRKLFCQKLQKNILTPKSKNYQHSYGNSPRFHPSCRHHQSRKPEVPPTISHMQGPSKDSIILHNRHNCGQRVPQHPGHVCALR
jgi:hypothetical protein